MPQIFSNWKQVPANLWNWPDFSPAEMACRGTGRLLIDDYSMDRLQALRRRLGKPLIINSAYRSPEHNDAVGGAPGSQHLKGKAYDVRMDNHDPEAFIAAAREEGFGGIGTYPDQGFVHIDTGPERQWGDPFPPRPTRFAEEKKPPTPLETIARPEVLGPAGGLVTGAGAVANGNGPVQFAIAVVLVLGAVALVGFFIWRARQQRPKD